MKCVKVTFQSTIRRDCCSIDLHLMLFWDIAWVICLLFLKYSIHSSVSCVNIEKERERQRGGEEVEGSGEI